MNLYTVKEVAEILKIAEGTLRNLIYKKKIKIVKVFGNVRITEDELKNIIKEV